MTIMPLAVDANQLAAPADIDPDPRHFHVGVIYTMLNLLSSYKKPPRGGLLPVAIRICAAMTIMTLAVDANQLAAPAGGPLRSCHVDVIYIMLNLLSRYKKTTSRWLNHPLTGEMVLIPRIELGTSPLPRVRSTN